MKKTVRNAEVNKGMTIKEQILNHEGDLIIENNSLLNFIIEKQTIEKVCLDNCEMKINHIVSSELKEFFWNKGCVLETVFEKVNLQNCYMKDTLFCGVQFENCDFKQEEFDFSAEFSKTIFKDVQMENQGIRYSKFLSCKFNDYISIRGIFEECEFLDCEMDNVTFKETAMWGKKIDSCTIRNSKLMMASFKGVEIGNCDFRNCIMDKFDFRKCKFENVIWCGNKHCNLIFENVKLKNIDMTGSEYQNVIFRNCEIDSIIVEDGSFRKVKFQNCKMEYIDFTTSNISDVTLEDCDMMDVYFSDEQCDCYNLL